MTCRNGTFGVVVLLKIPMLDLKLVKDIEVTMTIMIKDMTGFNRR